MATPCFADWIAAQAPLLDPVAAYSQDYFWLRRANGVVVPEANGVGVNITFPDYQSALGRRVVNPENWGGHDYILMKATNTGASDSRINLVVQTSSDPNNYSGALNAPFNIARGETKTMLFPLRPIDPRTYGLRRLPPILSSSYSIVDTGNQTYNLSTVYHWRLSYQLTMPGSLTVHDFRVLKYDDSLVGIVDRFGQYTDRSWSNKIVSEADFTDRLAEENDELAANPGRNEQFGSNTLRREPTARDWRTVRRNGRWYLVHPSGRLFWSMGLNGISEYQASRIDDRAHMYQFLPDQAGTFAPCYEMRTTQNGPRLAYKVYTHNLIHKYGSNYMDPWVAHTKRRLKSWGFNTVGSWSHTAYKDNTIPFTMYSHTADFPTRLATPYVHFNDLPDPYHNDFSGFLVAKFQTDFGNYVNRSNFMGVMVDNELSWGWDTDNTKRFNIALGAMRAPSSQPARTAFRLQLRNRYNNSIEALNASWGTAFATWNDFATVTWTPTAYTEGMIDDMKRFCRSFAATYYAKIRSALRQVGFRGLFMGSRYYPHTTEVWNAAAKYVDVYTVNLYGTGLGINWNQFQNRPKPVIISEFSFGLQANGSLGGPVECATPQERAANIRELLNIAVRQPNIVGMHWFEYTDQPLTGRSNDGENYGIGLVDIADNPHAETVDAFREVAQTLYSRRAAP